MAVLARVYNLRGRVEEHNALSPRMRTHILLNLAKSMIYYIITSPA